MWTIRVEAISNKRGGACTKNLCLLLHTRQAWKECAQKRRLGDGESRLDQGTGCCAVSWLDWPGCRLDQTTPLSKTLFITFQSHIGLLASESRQGFLILRAVIHVRKQGFFPTFKRSKNSPPLSKALTTRWSLSRVKGVIHHVRLALIKPCH